MWIGEHGCRIIFKHLFELTLKSPLHSSAPYHVTPKVRELESLKIQNSQNLINSKLPLLSGPHRSCSFQKRLDLFVLTSIIVHRNKVSVNYTYPPPRIDECIECFCTEKIFSTLDANYGNRKISVKVIQGD